MRKLLHISAILSALLATSMAANAGDLPSRPYVPPPVYVPPPFSWTGFYLGGNFGGAWTQSNVTDALFGLNFSSGNNNGAFIGGGQLGFNYQLSNLVIGVEADFDGVANTNSPNTLTGSAVLVPGIGTTQAIQVTSKNNWISTLAARFGVAYGDWLFYGKAGGGWVGNNNLTVTNVTTGASISGSNNNTNSGWLVGAGIEWAFANRWSWKLEYNYLGLASQTFTVPATFPILANDTFTQSNRNIQMVKVGLNYLFNWSGY